MMAYDDGQIFSILASEPKIPVPGTNETTYNRTLTYFPFEAPFQLTSPPTSAVSIPWNLDCGPMDASVGMVSKARFYYLCSVWKQRIRNGVICEAEMQKNSLSYSVPCFLSSVVDCRRLTVRQKQGRSDYTSTTAKQSRCKTYSLLKATLFPKCFISLVCFLCTVPPSSMSRSSWLSIGSDSTQLMGLYRITRLLISIYMGLIRQSNRGLGSLCQIAYQWTKCFTQVAVPARQPRNSSLQQSYRVCLALPWRLPWSLGGGESGNQERREQMMTTRCKRPWMGNITLKNPQAPIHDDSPC